jgi:hypothetical protein
MPIDQKGITHLFLILILLAGIGIGLYLVQNPQVFFPKASEVAGQAINPETFRLQNPKPETEKYLNPFGEAWETKIAYNPDIPVMLVAVFDRTKGGGYGVTDRQAQFNRLLPDYTPSNYPNQNTTYSLNLTPGYINLLKNSGPAFAYFGGSGFDSNKPRLNMPVQKIVDREVRKINPNLKLFGYHVISFTEECDLAGYPPLNCSSGSWPTTESSKENWFVHKKGADPTKAVNRLHAGATQFILDVTNPEYQDYMAEQLAKSMQNNGLDIVLVDGVSDYHRPSLTDEAGNAVPVNQLSNYYPDNLSDETFFKGKLAMLAKIKSKLTPLGKKVIANPIQPDAIDDTRLKQVNDILEVSDGFYWEDTFAAGKRDYFTRETGNPDYWYSRLQAFFEAVDKPGKVLIVESNTATSNLPPGYCKPAFICEYQKKLNEVGYDTWLKEEQRLARLNLGLYLLFMDPVRTVYKHHTLMEEISYETSEDFWADYDLKIGRPLAPKEKLADNIYRRWFNNGIVYVNNSPTQSYTVPSSFFTCDQMKGNICAKPHWITADGIPVTSYTLKPESAMFFVLPSVLEPFNPSFETVWNWKPNQANWGSVDYSQFKTGRRSIKVPSGLSGSPGLSQPYTFLPNTTYTWSAWVKTENNQNPQTMAVAVPGGVTSPNKVSEGRFVYDDIVPTGTNDWKKIQMTFTTQQGGGGNLYAVLQNSSNGTVWFDDVKIEEGAPFVLSKPVANCTKEGISRISVGWTSIGNYEYLIFARDMTNIDTEPQVGRTSGTGFNFTPQEGLIPGRSYGFAVRTTTPSGTVYAENSWSDRVFGPIQALNCASDSPSPTPTPSATPTPAPSATPAPKPLDLTSTSHALCELENSRIYLVWVPAND